MSNGLKRKNHYVPQMILKHFTNSKGLIYEFVNEQKNWNLPNGNKTDGAMTTAAIAKENSLYIQENKEKKLVDTLENNFSTIETQANPIICKLINFNDEKFICDISKILDKNDAYSLLYFIVMGYIRTPKYLDSQASIISSLVLESLNFSRLCNPDTPEELKNIDPRNGDFNVEIKTPFILKQILTNEHIDNIFNILNKYKWYIINNDTNIHFIMNDSFINMKNSGLINNNQLYIPIGKNKALLGVSDVSVNQKLQNNNIYNMQLKRNIIKEINFYSITNSHNFIYSSNRDASITNYINKNLKLINNKLQVFSGIGNLNYSPIASRKNTSSKDKSK